MFYEEDLGEIVSKFLLNTCGLPPWPNLHAMQALRLCSDIVNDHPLRDLDADMIPLVSGSVAEFYIQPMLPHIGDVDLMYHYNTVLAIPRGQSPPTQLPAEFHNYVEVVEIVDSHLPAYVYLELRYLLTECPADNKYIAVTCRPMFASNEWYHSDAVEIHGPARFHQTQNLAMLSWDEVHCVHCLLWPPQAADWPTRHRNYGWQDSATVDRVASNGCDVVDVAHRQCRQHQWMKSQ